MQIRGAVAMMVTALAVGGASVRAEQPGVPATLTVRPLQFTLDSQAPAPTTRLARLDAARLLAETQAALQSKVATAARDQWNCGMPVVRPPADVDPAFERKPDASRSVSIRRATPPACGR